MKYDWIDYIGFVIMTWLIGISFIYVIGMFLLPILGIIAFILNGV